MTRLVDRLWSEKIEPTMEAEGWPREFLSSEVAYKHLEPTLAFFERAAAQFIKYPKSEHGKKTLRTASAAVIAAMHCGHGAWLEAPKRKKRRRSKDTRLDGEQLRKMIEENLGPMDEGPLAGTISAQDKPQEGPV